jgi:hypothetical protein
MSQDGNVFTRSPALLTPYVLRLSTCERACPGAGALRTHGSYKDMLTEREKSGNGRKEKGDVLAHQTSLPRLATGLPRTPGRWEAVPPPPKGLILRFMRTLADSVAQTDAGHANEADQTALGHRLAA